MTRNRTLEVATLSMVIWLSVIMTAIFAEPIRDLIIRGETIDFIKAAGFMLMWIFVPLYLFYEVAKVGRRKRRRPRRK